MLAAVVLSWLMTVTGELVERCCDGLLIARRRRPLWTR
jgi:hypothetical protein